MSKGAQQPYVYGRYRKQEEKDTEAFVGLIPFFPNNYAVTAATAYGSEVDVVSANLTGGTVLTEIKGRMGRRLDDDDVMIEPKKLECLERFWKEKGIWTFYLNFYEGTGVAYLFFIPAIMHLKDTFRFEKDLPIRWSDGTKYEDRYFIPREYGYRIDTRSGIVLEKPVKNRKVAAPKAYDIPFGKGEITMKEIEEANERQETQTDG